MAGHSQFKNIMHRKGRQDAQRSRLFAKLGRELTVAARSGLPDPASNPRLRAAVQAARGANMSRDTIERAIKRGAGGGDDSNYAEVRYEGFGPGGVAIIVEALTDNRNRTAGDVRTAFGKHGGTLGATNSVSHQFGRVGEIVYPAKAASGDAVFEAALDAGADDVASDEEVHTIHCEPDALGSVREALEARFGPPERARLGWKPLATVPLAEDNARTLLKLLDVLEDNDDVQSVVANFEIADDLMARLTGEGAGSCAQLARGAHAPNWPEARMRLIGLDPGLRNTGWGVIDVTGSHLRFVAAGTVSTDSAMDLPGRLAALHDGLLAVLDRYRPQEAAVEETFVNKNPDSTLKLGLARGVVLLVPARAGLPVAEYGANHVKKSIVGAGHAEKSQVAMMVGRLLPGSGAHGKDAADALAVAICHAHHRATNRRWQAGQVLAGSAP